MITYFKIVSGTAVSGVLCRIADEAGVRHELFGRRLEWAAVSEKYAENPGGRMEEITARRAGEITAQLRRGASREA